MPLGRKNIALTLDTEPLEGLQSIPLARVTRETIPATTSMTGRLSRRACRSAAANG